MWGGNTMVTNDNCPPAGSPYPYANLGNACQTAGKTWRAYSENLGSVGSTACSFNGTASTGLYTRKHDPWVSYSNLDHTRERPYTDLALDIAANTLPNLAYVIPNNCHNSHNSTTPGCTIADADVWLSQNLPAMISAVGPRGLVVLTWDEDDNSVGNHILTMFVGPQVMPGVTSNRQINHYTVLRTICDALELPAVGAAFSELPITDVWQSPVPALERSWGSLKILYR
jgi:acid phosphatase